MEDKKPDNKRTQVAPVVIPPPEAPAASFDRKVTKGLEETREKRRNLEK